MTSVRASSVWSPPAVAFACIVALSLLATALPASAGDGGLEMGSCEALVEDGRFREAMLCLKALPPGAMDESENAYLLARVYQGMGNVVWTRRTLESLLSRNPADCEVRAWLVWVLLSQSNYREADAILSELMAEAQGTPEGGAAVQVTEENLVEAERWLFAEDASWSPERCPATELDLARWILLKSVVALQAGELETARLLVRRMKFTPALYPEDVALLVNTRSALWPLRQAPIQVSLSGEAGWTSNALLGSPADPTASDENPASPRSDLRGWGRVRLGNSALGSFLESDARITSFYAEVASEHGYFQQSIRSGAELALDSLVAQLAYRYEYLVLNGADRYGEVPYLFYTAHRAEFDADFQGGLSLFGGGGRRLFRQMGRTRWEADLGAGFLWAASGPFSGAVALSARYQKAQFEAFDMFGATVLASAAMTTAQHWVLRLVVTAMADVYPNSKGDAGVEAFNEVGGREEVLARARLSVTSPPLFDSARASLWYEWTTRDSTAASYDFSAHTIMAGLSWNFRTDPWVPPSQAPQGHRALPYALEDSIHADGDRLRDLLRRDEDAQKGCSCGN